MFFYNLIVSEGSISDKLLVALAFVLSATFAIVIHEVSHGYVALLNGDFTAKSRGRLTLNPAAHFDLIGVIMVLIIGFGWAKPVPINSANFTKYKRGMLTVSFAGVGANVVIASVSLLLYFLCMPLFYFVEINSKFAEVLVTLLFYVLYCSIRVNLMLALFNLIPIYPLDGYNIVNTFLKPYNKYQEFMVRYGSYCLIGIILLAYVGRLTGLTWLDIFGSFNNVITKLVETVTKSGLITWFEWLY